MGGYTEQSADIQEYANLEDSKRNLMSAVTTSASKTVADRKKFCEDTYRLVKKMETDIRKELRENYEKWLFMLPLQPAGPTQTQTYHTDAKLPTTPRRGFLTDIVQVRRD